MRICGQCGQEYRPRRKGQRFCTDICRYNYWNKHRPVSRIGNTTRRSNGSNNIDSTVSSDSVSTPSS
jgi:hypothetical protein